MARIRCKYLDCAFLDEGYCSAALVELDSNKGCLTYSPNAETPVEDDWTDTEELEDWEDLVEEEEDKDDDPWMEEEEEDEF
ncbi:MAG: hypothetical protein AB9907_02000 [Flexilinea sp.]|jgi:hypothetical protein